MRVVMKRLLMKRLLSPRLVSRLTGLLILAAFAGCNSSRQNEQPVFSVTDNASADSVQFFSASPSELRHQQRLVHSPQSHHHPQSQWPEAPTAVNRSIDRRTCNRHRAITH